MSVWVKMKFYSGGLKMQLYLYLFPYHLISVQDQVGFGIMILATF